MRKYFSWWSILYSLSLLLACQAKTENNTIIARVGDEKITFESIDSTYFPNLELYDDSASQHQAALNYLDSLINQKLLVRAAYEARLDQDREINILMDEQKPRLLIDELYKMVVLEKSEPTERELKDYYQKSGEQRKLRHILVKDRAEAEQIYQELKKGANFDTLATEKSIDPGSKDYGGDLGLVSWGSMVDPFQQAAWKLKVGQISKPVESSFGWHVIKLEEIKKLDQKPFEEVSQLQKQRLQFTKQNRLTQEFLDQLKAKSGVEMDTTTYGLMLQRDSTEAKKDLLSPPKPSGSYLKLDLFSESQRGLPLLSYKGGSITVKDFVEQYAKIPAFQKGSFDNRQQVEQWAFQMVMGDLLEKEAEKRGTDSRPVFKQNLLKLKETLMADKMRNDLIMLRVKITEEDLHSYYDTHLEQFQIPENVKIQEVLVATEPEAKKLAQQIKAGANFTKLADQYTLRPGLKGKGGILDSITLQKSEILFNAVKEAKKGQVVGPVPFNEKFSVIKLLERRPTKQLAFEEVQPRLRSLAYEDEKRTTFKNWIESRKQNDKVETFPEVYINKVFGKLSELHASRPPGDRKRLSGKLPMKIKIGPEGQIQQVEDEGK